MTPREKAHADRKAALPPLARPELTTAQHVVARREREAAKAEAHREATMQGPHVHVEAREWPILGAGWGDAETRTEHTRMSQAARERKRARNLAILPLAGPELASPKRPHDPRQWTPAKVRGR